MPRLPRRRPRRPPARAIICPAACRATPKAGERDAAGAPATRASSGPDPAADRPEARRPRLALLGAGPTSSAILIARASRHRAVKRAQRMLRAPRAAPHALRRARENARAGREARGEARRRCSPSSRGEELAAREVFRRGPAVRRTRALSLSRASPRPRGAECKHSGEVYALKALHKADRGQ